MLRTRHVPVDVICSVCLSAEESIWHILFQCNLEKACWQLFPHRFTISDQLEFVEALAHIFSTLPMDDQSLLAILYWSIWDSRNQRVWKSLQLSPR